MKQYSFDFTEILSLFEKTYFAKYLLFFLILLNISHANSAETEYDEFIQKTKAQIESIRARPKEKWPAGCSILYKQIFDLNDLAQTSAQKHWILMDSDLRKKLAAAIEKQLIMECMRIVAQSPGSDPIIRRAIKKGEKFKVTVEYFDNTGKKTVVTWTLVSGGSYSMRALDVTANGRGMVSALISDFEGALSATGGDIGRAIGIMVK